jgi:hypothetical protein
MTAPAAGSVPAALERLATALGPRFSTTLVTGPGRRPCLAVTSRHTAAGDNIYADAVAYWWSWVEWVHDSFVGDDLGRCRGLGV